MIDEWEIQKLIFEHHEAVKFLRAKLGKYGITQKDIDYHIARKQYWKEKKVRK